MDSPDGTAVRRGVRMATDLQQLVVALVDADPDINTVKKLQAAIKSVESELGFQVEPKELKPKSLAKMMGKKPKSPAKVMGKKQPTARGGSDSLVRQASAGERSAAATAREQTAAARAQREADSAELARVNSALMALRPVPLRDYMSGVLIRRGHRVVEEALNPFVKGCMRASYPSDWLKKCCENLGRATKGHATEEGRWDLYMLVDVMRANMRGVFAPHIGCGEYAAKDLLTRLLQASELRTRRAHQAIPTEAEAVEALGLMRRVLMQCGIDGDAQRVQEVITEAQELVETARTIEAAGGTDVRQVRFSAQDFRAFVFYRALCDFEHQLQRNVGSWQPGYAFPSMREASAERAQRVTSVRSSLKIISGARNAYFHGSAGSPVGNAATGGQSQAAITLLEEMGKVLRKLHGIKFPDTPLTEDDGSVETGWSWHQQVCGHDESTVDVSVQLEITGRRMSIPQPRARELVGRTSIIEQATEALLGRAGSRVLIHGLPGVGKDVIAAGVVRSEDIAERTDLRLQAWLQGSTNSGLRTQLVEQFETHWPVVVKGAADQAEKLGRIRSWLSTNSESWLFVVEDATWESQALWECFPAGKGRLLVTSQNPLHSREAHHEVFRAEDVIEVPPLSTDDCIQVWNLMSPFTVQRESMVTTEDELKMKCDATSGSPFAVEYEPGDPGETGKQRKARHRRLNIECFKCEQLGSPQLRDFMVQELGNLPLSVSLCGHMLRELGSVDALIERFPAVPLDGIDQAGFNPMSDTHYFGLTRSVLFAIDRLERSEEYADSEKRLAFELLASMSMLPTAVTPTVLFEGSSSGPQLTEDAPLPNLYSAEGFVTAKLILRQFGLLQPSGDPDLVGSMHQLMQKCVQERIVCPACGPELARTTSTVGSLAIECASSAVSTLRCVLTDRCQYSGDPSGWGELRAIAPCVERWRHLCTTRNGLSPGLNEVRMLVALGKLLRDANGDPKGAETVCQDTLQLAHAVLPVDHPDIASSMGSLAHTYGQLGRHEEALKLNEETLAFDKRVLPADHPDIATSMGNLAHTYGELGRHEEALKLEEETLAFRKRVLPADHPDIATSMGNLALTYGELGRHEEALKLEEETLAFCKRVLPADHPDIASSMSNLAGTYGELGRHEEALKLKEEALAFDKRVLPADHPDIATIMSNLAHTYGELGRHEEALKLKEEALAFRKRVLPADHPDIATIMSNLAHTYGELGRHEEALKLNEEALAFDKRVLPADHPDIATSMSNLAHTYGELGRHEEALKLKEEALAFRKRVLPADHPDIATSMGNLALTHYAIGHLLEAELLLKDALRIRLLVLPPGHGDTQATMHDLKIVRETMRGAVWAPKSSARVKPNAQCPCGSGRKYKKCCGKG